eukprot:scaffold660_cov134-Isochrysis_galbana.AAC.2
MESCDDESQRGLLFTAHTAHVRGGRRSDPRAPFRGRAVPPARPPKSNNPGVCRVCARVLPGHRLASQAPGPRRLRWKSRVGQLCIVVACIDGSTGASRGVPIYPYPLPTTGSHVARHVRGSALKDLEGWRALGLVDLMVPPYRSGISRKMARNPGLVINSGPR